MGGVGDMADGNLHVGVAAVVDVMFVVVDGDVGVAGAAASASQACAHAAQADSCSRSGSWSVRAVSE